MLGHDLEMSCTKCHGNRRKACAPGNCVIDYRYMVSDEVMVDQHLTRWPNIMSALA